MKSSHHHIEINRKRKSTLLKKVDSYIRTIAKNQKAIDYTQPESSLYVANDATYQNSIKKALKPLRGAKVVILVGIGGSSLGTQAIYNALAYTTSPKLVVIDDVDIEAQKQLKSFLDTIHSMEDVALVVASKSGTTTETMLNGAKVLEMCVQKFGASFTGRTVFVGNAGTPFMKIGKKKKIICLSIPEGIGGRYSVFTAIGIVPLTLINIDIISLVQGVQDALKPKAREAARDSAVSLALLTYEGIQTLNFFTFNARLESLGLWYRQLFAESIGKRMTKKSVTFTHQILPIVSQSTDLHSMVQLYLGGYPGIFTHFVHFYESDSFHARTVSWLLEHVPFLQKREFREVHDAISHGVIQAYNDKKLPYRNTVLTHCTAYDIGYFMTASMLEVMCLAHALDINAFDQPNVEDYKKHTRKALN